MVNLRVDIPDAEDGLARAFFLGDDYPFDNILLVGLGQDGLCREMKLEELLCKDGGSQTLSRRKVTKFLHYAGGLCCLKLSTIRCSIKETSVRGSSRKCLGGVCECTGARSPCEYEEVHLGWRNHSQRRLSNKGFPTKRLLGDGAQNIAAKLDVPKRLYDMV